MHDLRGGVRRSAYRVALIATGIVAVIYSLVAVSVLVIVGHNLTSDIDRRLDDGLTRLQTTGHLRLDPGQGYDVPSNGPRYGTPLLVWTVFPDGSVNNNNGATLPSDGLHVGQPRTVSVNGVDVRITGRDISGLHVVLGQSTGAVAQAQANLLLAEVVVAPLLLAAVFLGSSLVGRRVAAPVERARQRQLAFTADASHELRTPLAVIEAQASLAAQRGRDVAWYENALRRIDGESKRMRRLVDDMLWLARFDTAAARPQGELVDLGVLAEAAADRFTSVAESRGTRITTQVLATTPIVSAPPDWLDRLAGVLLDNACRYTPAGGHVRITVADEGERVAVRVDDSGPGIPVEERGQIFDRFHRASEVAGGAGLGLAIADAVVQASGGRWRIGDSDLGGASMSVSWPRIQVGIAPSTTDGEQRSQRNSQMGDAYGAKPG